LIQAAIRELISLRGRKNLSRGDRANARENIRVLFNFGFIEGEIGYFANWLKVDTIKKYCRGLEVKSMEEKERILALLGEFSGIDGDWDELEYFVDSKKKLMKEDLSLDDLLTLKNDVDRFNIDLKDFGRLSASFDKDNKDWEWFLDKVSMLNQLQELGYTIEILTEIKELTDKIGLEATFERIVNVVIVEKNKATLEKFKKIEEERVTELKDVENKIKQLNLEYTTKKTHVNYAEKLIDEYNLDLSALKTIISTAEKWGEPIDIMEALNKYNKLQEIDINIKAKKEELKTSTEEISTKKTEKENLETQVNVIHHKIGEIEERHRHSRKLQKIANLLDDPAGAKLSFQEFNILCLSLLIAIRDFAYSHSGSMTLYNRYVKIHVENATNNLNNIVSGKLT
jgi:hypothetical protein